MALLYEEKVKTNKAAFISKVKEIAAALSIDPNWLMLIINFESAGTFSPSKTNSIGCTGLIQFCPDSKDVDYKTFGNERVKLSTLANMSNVQQLDYVYKYYKPLAHRIVSYVDLYLATLFPLAMGKPDDFILQSDKHNIKADTVARQNPALNLDRDGKITVAEVKQKMLSLVPEAWREVFEKKIDTAIKTVKRAAEDTKEFTKETVEETKEVAQQAAAATKVFVKKNWKPLAIGGGAVFIFLTAFLIYKTKYK